ncbi:MAG TPA: trehalose-6-phosphate synthase, partial [Solirubrobacterales bacterium]|nr:trehalose-6-phosphate synthase [Solirubrobacterales bacterium]
MDSSPLIIVSNRGPAQFERDEQGQRTVRRGGGGLVTALSGLVSHRDALWIASAMTDEDVVVSEERGGPVELSIDGIDYRVALVDSDPVAYDRFYNVIANPILWFIQHYLWDLSNAPDIRQEELDAWDFGYQAVNRDIANAVLRQLEGQEQPLVMLHDYHLYTAPGMIREQRPDVFLHHFVHIPWSQPDSWRVLPGRIREAIFQGMLANDIIGFHTHAYCINFLRCCDELLEADVDYVKGVVHHERGKTLARAYPLSIDAARLERAAASPEVAAAEREVLERRRKHLIIRVDRADLSKNVLRGFTAFDTFLAQHPEFREEVTFIAHLQPSRQDVPEYAEYLERIEALVAVVNHRHGTTDWMPIDLRIYENFHDAVARYKHFDLLMVNAIFDGMNLVAKEAPAVNTRDGVLMLSENTGSHEELGDCVLSVNPFDIQEQADAIYRALTMDPEERRVRAERLKEIIFARNPGDWVDEQLADIAEVRGEGRDGPPPAETVRPAVPGDA